MAIRAKGCVGAAAAFALTALLVSPATAGERYLGAAPAVIALSPASNYVINPDDTLEIAVFQVPDLTRTVQVDSSGTVLLPLIGSIDARGQTPNQLSERIATELRKKYIRNPQVAVTVKDSISQKFTVDGAVIQPGLYPVTGPTTLLQAVAMAKGPDPRQANTRNVSIFRVSNGARVGASYNLSAIRSGKAADPPVYARDVIVVAGSGGKTFLNNFSTLFPIASLLKPW